MWTVVHQFIIFNATCKSVERLKLTFIRCKSLFEFGVFKIWIWCSFEKIFLRIWCMNKLKIIDEKKPFSMINFVKRKFIFSSCFISRLQTFNIRHKQISKWFIWCSNPGIRIACIHGTWKIITQQSHDTRYTQQNKQPNLYKNQRMHKFDHFFSTGFFLSSDLTVF